MSLPFNYFDALDGVAELPKKPPPTDTELQAQVQQAEKKLNELLKKSRERCQK